MTARFAGRSVLAVAAFFGVACGGKSSSEDTGCPEGVVALVGLAEWSSLEGALGSAGSSGPTEIELCPGTFEVRTRLVKPGAGWDRIILRGHPDGTVLDGGGLGTVLDLEGNGTVELHQLTIQNGRADAGGGGYRGRGMQLLILDRVVFQHNEAPGAGAAIRLDDDGSGAVTLEDGGEGGSQFIDNHAGGNGGAISLESSEWASFSPGGWVFSGNSAGGHGGAVALDAADSVGMFGDLSAEGQQAGGDGGVLYIDAPSAPGLVLGGLEASDNRAGSEGGVVRLDGTSGADLSVQSATLSGNDAVRGGALSVGPGWSLQVAQTVMNDNSPDDLHYDGTAYSGEELGENFACSQDVGCEAAR